MAQRALVIGGGPGGSTTAALLAAGGLEVWLLERDTFPRYHIGESLASSCREVLSLSGAVDKVDAAGFPVKQGALWRWGAEADWTINWSQQMGPNVSSWQVDRADFDKLLLDHADSRGVRVVQGASVKRVLFDGDRGYAAEWIHDSGTHFTEFDYLVDASGRAGVLSAQHFRDRRRHEIFRNVAIWGYFDGGATLPNTPPGGIDVISHPDGWYWVIPLRGGRHSVGFVTHQATFLARRKDFTNIEEMYFALVSESDTVRGLVSGASLSSSIRVEQDYSYVADSFCGPNYFLVGDAACFLDPLLSTGVHLALYSALLAAATVLAISRGEVTDEEGRGFYETAYRNAYARLLVLVSSVYEQYRGKSNYFWTAQRMVAEKQGLSVRPDAAFTDIISGSSDLRDARGGQAATVTLKLIEAAERARQAAAASSPSGVPIASLRIDPRDLADAASGLHLITTPHLGIGRA
ncbi:MAG TPA: NAD(P)/FAD-dependent oxidoreductase [Pseudonocardiaceae bacterium]|jgi:flavin-dependent dehydrogenase